MTGGVPDSTPRVGHPSRPFDDLVADRTGADFVERAWLVDEVERALLADGVSYVLVTGEPGSGKTSLLAGVARAHLDWPRYFVRRDGRVALAGADVQSFLLSVGHQLAQLRPEIFEPARLAVVVRQRLETVPAGGRAVGIRVEDLIVSPFRRTAVLEVEQHVAVTAGTVVGIEVGTATLEPRLLEPDNLAHLALIDPAEVLLDVDPQARIVVILDALDELAGRSGGLLEWLTDGPELPSNVRVLMSSRPHAALGALRAARADRLREVAIDTSSGPVREDLLGYAKRMLAGDRVADAVTAQGLFLDQLRWDAVARAAGNFLYLATYAKALNDAVSRADGELVARLLTFDRLPPGLDGLYAFFIETARADLVRLGMLEIRDPVATADRLAPAWEAVAQPILGLLTAAREPLTVEQLIALGGIRVWPRSVHGVVSRLRWLLDLRDGRVAFFHSSVREFLASDHAVSGRPDWAVDESEWHERIVRHYRGSASSWAAVEWEAVDDYGLIHVAEHVVACRPPVGDDVAELVCPALRRAIRNRLGSDRYFVGIVELAVERAIDASSPATGLPTVLYLAVVRRQVLRSSRRLAPAVIGLLARMGRSNEALEHAAALPPSRQQVEAMREIIAHAGSDDDPERRRELFDLLVEAALTVPGDKERGEAMKLVAEEVAAHDLRRALRLWERANEIAFDEEAAPDAVYRAAARASDPDAARELIARIGTGRAGDYLDLAARVESVEVSDLLRQAELSLTANDPAERLGCLGRLAAAWAPFRRDEYGRLITTLRTEIDRETGKEAASTRGLVAAAAAVAEVDRSVAAALLDRLEAVSVDGLVADALFEAAALWVSFGSRDKAGRLLWRLGSWNDSVSTKVRIAAVVGAFDPSMAQRILDDAYGTIPAAAAVQGRMGQTLRESGLARVAFALGAYDLRRAANVAREMQNVSWSVRDADRHTTLARLAHLQLDAGNVDEAALLVEESLRFAEAPPLVDTRRVVPFRRVPDSPDAAPAGRAGETDFDLQVTFLMNHTRDWEMLREERFYLDPAEVVSAISPGPGSTGNPHTWARTMRVLAEEIGERDLPRAVRLVRAIADGCERAVGLAAMFRIAARGSDRELDRRLWDEVTAALDGIEHYEWLMGDRLFDQDRQAFAYVRPDHRARFDVAIRLIPYEADAAMDLLARSGAAYLLYAFHATFAAWASGAYATRASRGERPVPVFERLHRSALTAPPPSEGEDDLLGNIVRARAAANEYLVASSTGLPPDPALPPQIDDPLYAAFVALLATTVGEPAIAFVQRLRGLISGPRLPAAAALAAFAAQKGIGRSREVLDLCADIQAATHDGPPATRVVTLLPFAVAPGHAPPVDAAELLAETLRLGADPWERVEYDEALAGLFPVLLERYPALALRLLHDAVAENWDRAMALLEHGAETLVGALGDSIAELLHRAIVRGLECASRDGMAPPVVDGVEVA
jgi:hypothetical protein